MVRALIIDDEQPSRFVIAAILRETGRGTLEVANGYEALPPARQRTRPHFACYQRYTYVANGRPTPT